MTPKVARPLTRINSLKRWQTSGRFNEFEFFSRLFPKVVEAQALAKYYDVSGSFAYEDFIRGLREPLSSRRQQIVLKAFSLLDKNEEGRITVSDIQ
jgi:Ca2+-binding EF-hand superfamily protein